MKLSISLAAGLLASASFATIAHAGEISGHVGDDQGTRAFQSASVRIVELNRSADTDRAGAYVFGDVPAGTYTIEARYVGAATATQTVTVPATGGITGDFRLAAVGGGDILVIGQTANITSALSRQKAADGVESVLTRDGVGQFPDQNVAESLRRLPGVNILDDQGEGRYVSVRGLDPELNSTSLNGVRLPSPESDVRSVALDVISSDTIESIEVKKSFTPDMDGDFIGASIEIKSTSAFDSKKDRLSASLEGSWNHRSDKLTPKAGLDFTKKIGSDFGIAGSLSYYKRKFETLGIETGDPWETDGNGNAWAGSFEDRDYHVTRTRINGALSLDWKATPTTKAYIRGNWAQFDDHELRNRTIYDFTDFDDPTSSTSSSATFNSADGNVTIKKDLKDRFERQRIRSVAIGSDTDTGTWKFNWQGSYAKSSEIETYSIDPIRFNAKFKKSAGVQITADYADAKNPIAVVDSGQDEIDDDGNYSLNRVSLTDLSKSVDREWAAKADLARTFAGDNGDFTVQGGAKVRLRKKSYDYNELYYDDYGDDGLTLDQFGGSLSDASQFFRDNQADFSLDDYTSGIDSATSDYSATENIYAGYLLGRWDSSTLRVIAGVRMEHTHNDLKGNDVTDLGDSFTVDPVEYKRDYTNWLPSLTLRWSPQHNLVARLAGYKTVVRPKLSQMAPRTTISVDSDDETDRKVEAGNTDLKPYQAWNLDAGFDYYFSGNGAFSFGAFYKSIKDYTYTYTTDTPGTYNGIAYSELTLAENGKAATIAGVELSYSQVFSMLPAPFDGLLTQLNYTYTYSNGDIGRDITLPSASKNTFNVVLGYEKGPVSLRAAGTYRDKYLDIVGDDASTDRIVDQHFQLDLSAKYKLTDNIRLFADWVNVNNAKYYAYENYAGARRLLQYESYGSTVKFGARVTF